MGTVDMDIKAAESFNNELTNLNSRLETILKGINQAVQDIGKSGEGSIIKQLWDRAKEMFDAAVSMVKAFGNLVNSIAEVIGAAGQLMNTINEAIANVGKFFGF